MQTFFVVKVIYRQKGNELYGLSTLLLKVKVFSLGMFSTELDGAFLTG
jgi:hypothetical protein